MKELFIKIFSKLWNLLTQNFNRLSFEDANFAFPAENKIYVVREINLDIPKDKAIGITGHPFQGRPR